MNKNQLRKLQLIQSMRHDLDPVVALKDRQLIAEAKRPKRDEYLGWLAIFLVLPVPFLSDKPSTTALSAFLLLWLVYLLYVSAAAYQKVGVDFHLKEVKVYPSSGFLLKFGLYRQRRLDFGQIARIRLSDKPLGKGQPSGKSLYIETKEQKTLRLLNFRNGESAEQFGSLLSELLQTNLIRK